VSGQGRILVVDDIPQNVKLLTDLLGVKGYDVVTAGSGEEGLAKVASESPDLILLDVMMPGMSGYDVCRKIRSDPATALLPIIFCTSLDPLQERINGIAAGADDFLSKPINQPELFARVASLLRIKRLHEQTQKQAAQLAEWSATLEMRVAEQVAENERLSRLKRFFSPKLAELIVDGNGEDPLKSRRREIVVVYSDLRGFTAFAETSEPEELMRTLGSFHAAMGRLVLAHEATLERFTGDGMMVFLGDPVPIDDAAAKAVALALAMREAAGELSARWQKRGVDLGLGIGVAQGFATVGAIGFEGRIDYGAIGTVTNLAARLCLQG
jgi:adenylate cyclase